MNDQKNGHKLSAASHVPLIFPPNNNLKLVANVKFFIIGYKEHQWPPKPTKSVLIMARTGLLRWTVMFLTYYQIQQFLILAMETLHPVGNSDSKVLFYSTILSVCSHFTIAEPCVIF